MSSFIRTIERRHERGDLEVEHLLALLKKPDPSIGNELAALSAKLSWPSLREAQLRSTKTRKVVPYGAWAEVVAAYCIGGLCALGELLKRSATSGFVLAACETIRTSESLEFLLTRLDPLIAEPSSNIEGAVKLAAALNTMLSFKPRVIVSTEQKIIVRRFLERLARDANKPEIRGTAYCALRAVGDVGSIELMESLPRLTGCWASSQTAAKRAILKRLRDEA